MVTRLLPNRLPKTSKKGTKKVNEEARYRTADLVSLFTQLANDGISGMNGKLISDLIAQRLPQFEDRNTISELKQYLEGYESNTAVFWQIYTHTEAALPEEDFGAVASSLMNDQEFLEDLHELITERAYKIHTQLKEGMNN
jgi:hypothetical protein